MNDVDEELVARLLGSAEVAKAFAEQALSESPETSEQFAEIVEALSIWGSWFEQPPTLH